MVKKEWKNVYFQLFRENESKPLCVCRAKRISLGETEGKTENVTGIINDFFPLMGSIMELISDPGFSGSTHKYVICWADDTVDDEKKMWKKLTGVRFLESIDTIGGCDKQRYRGRFIAEKLIE
ncbi:MAG: hypothetical protein ACTSQY_02685 [Candidatus Odinarchaeia archaeon]